MFEVIRKSIAKFKTQRQSETFLKSGKAKYYYSARMVQNDKNLKKYIPIFEKLGDTYYKLLYENNDKTDIEHLFARLMILKQTELYSSIMILTFFEFTHSIIPVMRNFCDTVLFLKYVEIHPEYIKRFMEKEGRGVSIYQIKNEIPDKELIAYYDYLSGLMHSNPESIKLTYYSSSDSKKNGIISFTPLNQNEFKEAYISSLYYFMNESIPIIMKIYSKQWKPK
jgi:hypothetical protein